jgi:hypothetical protein
MADMDTAPVAMVMDIEQPVEGEEVAPVVSALEAEVEAAPVPAQVCVARNHAVVPPRSPLSRYTCDRPTGGPDAAWCGCVCPT